VDFVLKWQWLLALIFPITLKVGDFYIIKASQSGTRSQVNIDRLPLQLGDWKGTALSSSETLEKLLPEDTVVQRTYTNSKQEQLAVSLVYSNQWESLHPPQNCLTAAGYEIVRETTAELHTAGGPVRASVITALKKPADAVTELYLFTDANATSSTWLERYAQIMLQHGRAGAQSSCLLLVTRQHKDASFSAVAAAPTIDFAERFLPYVQYSLQD
jgi:hypothetical protein